MKTLITLLLGILIQSSVFAQKYNVNGLVEDATNGEPILGATVSILSTDSILIKGGSTGKSGNFSLTLTKPGKYILKTSFMGLISKYNNVVVSKTTPTVNIGKICLKENAIMLKETEISVQKLMIITKKDTIIYNADAFNTAEGSTLNELLKKIPGVEIEGNTIKVNGKAVSRILINGDDFFGTDAEKALKNLPVYMIENVKSYEKENEKNKISGFDDGSRENVLDVTLKRKYLGSWLATMNGAYGTDDLYMFRAFGTRFDDRIRISTYASANNANNSQTPNENGEWGDSNSSNGTFTYKSVGADINYKNKQPDSLGGFLKLRGNVAYTFTNSHNNSGDFSETFLPTNSSYNSNEYNHKRRATALAMALNLEWKPTKQTYLNLSPRIDYQDSKSNAFNRSATWNQDPYASSSAPLDSVFQGNNSNPFHGGLVNSSEYINYYVSDNTNFKTDFYALHRLSPNDNIALRGNISYKNSTSKNYNATNYRYYQIENKDEVQNKYQLTPNESFTFFSWLDYNRKFSKEMNLRTTYGFYKGHFSSPSSLYRLDSLGGKWEQMNGYPLGTIPSTADSLAMALEIQNSYSSISEGIHQWFECAFNWNLGDKFSLFAQFSVQPYTDFLKYERGDKKYDIQKTYVHYAPTARLKYKTDSVSTLELNYNNSYTSPYQLFDLLDIYDDSNPLNIRQGNPDLKSYYTNNFGLTYNTFLKNKRSLYARLNYSYSTSNYRNVMTYNPETGVRTTRPENVDGDKRVNANVYYSAPLDEKNRWNMQTSLWGNYSRMVNFTSLSTALSSVRNVVKSYYFGPSLQLRYEQEKFSITAYARATANFSKSDFSVSNHETYEVQYGPSAWIKFPWDIRLDAELEMNTLRGYDDKKMNNTRFNLNASLSKPLFKDKRATIKLVGNDLLDDQQFYFSSTRAEGRSSYWSKGIGRYAMIHFIYRFQMKKG